MALKKEKLGSYRVATGWDDVTLRQWSDYVKYASEQNEKEEQMDLITILEMFSDIPRDTIMQMPVEMFEKIYQNLTFLQDEIDLDEKPSPIIDIDDVKYQVNYMEKMKVHEYLDMSTVLDADKYNYPMIFAILCRKDGEEYDDEFIANTLSERVKIFDNISVKKAFPVIGFFFVLYAKYQILSQNSSHLEELREAALELVSNIETSLKPMVYITPSKWKVITTLAKCKKSLNSI